MSARLLWAKGEEDGTDGRPGVLRWRRAALMKSRWFRLTVSVGLLGWLCAKTRILGHLHEGYENLRIPYAVAGVSFGVLTLAVRAWRWNIILADIGRPLPVIRLLRVYAAAFFLGLVSPGRLGELVRVWMARDHATSLPSAAVSVVFDRIFDVVPTLLIAAAFSVSIGSGETSHVVAGVRVALVVLLLISVLMLCFPGWLQSKVEHLAGSVLHRFGLREETEPLPSRPLSRRALLAAFTVSVFSQMIIVTQTWLYCKAISSHINPLATFAIVTMATLVASLPLSIGGIGTREVAIAGALSTLGVSSGQAIGFSLLSLVNFIVVATVTMAAFVGRPSDVPGLRRASDLNASDVNTPSAARQSG